MVRVLATAVPTRLPLTVTSPTPRPPTPTARSMGETRVINETMYAYGASKSSIREIAAYGNARKAQIGAENGGQSSRRRYQSAGLQTCYEK